MPKGAISTGSTNLPSKVTKVAPPAAKNIESSTLSESADNNTVTAVPKDERLAYSNTFSKKIIPEVQLNDKEVKVANDTWSKLGAQLV